MEWTRKRFGWVAVMLLDAAAVLGVTAILAASLLVGLAATGRPLSHDAGGTLILRDGTVLPFRSRAEHDALVQRHEGEIRGAKIEPTPILSSALGLLFPLVYLVGFGYVALLERRRLRRWLRAAPRRVALGVALGAGAAVTSYLYEKGARHFGFTFEDLQIPLRVVGFAAFFVLAAIVAPIVEELYFRGRLFRAIEEANGRRAALWITSVVFAAIHVPTVPLALPPYLLISYLLGWQRARNGTLDGSIATHATNNAIAVAAAAFLGH